MEKFVEKYTLPKLNEEEVESMNRPITAGKIEAVIKKLLAPKSPGPDGFTGKFYKTFKEVLTYILLRIFQNPRREKTTKVFLESQHHCNFKTR